MGLGLTWSIKELVDMLKARQGNEFDGNMAVSGDRGNGKSTLILKMFYRFSWFKPNTHQEYNSKKVISLLRDQEYKGVWDDEAINSSYRRNWQDKTQQELIKTLTMYRDNYNVYASAIPNFFTLDKDLRDLFFLHVHIIERGVGVVHMPLQGRLYSQDRWDAKYNAKIEQSWSKRIQKDPNFRPPYNRLSTFRGFVFFNDCTPKQRKLYKEIKKDKRAKLTDSENDDKKELSFEDKLYKLLIEGKLTKEGIIQACLLEGRKYSSINAKLNVMLKDHGELRTMKDCLQRLPKCTVHSSDQDRISNEIPDI